MESITRQHGLRERSTNGQKTRCKGGCLKIGYQDKTTTEDDLLLVVCLIVYIFGPAREAFERGVQLARGFPPRGKWTYGEVFHPAVVPQPLFRLV